MDRLAAFGVEIRNRHRQFVVDAVETGQTLTKSKVALGSDVFEEMDLPFGLREAESYMELAAHPCWSRADNLAEAFDKLSDTEREEVETLVHNVLDSMLDSMESIK